MNILIAEDDENARYLLETVLVAKAYSVVSFDNGLKALTYLQTHQVDLIISDVSMPEMDGYAFCRAVKQSPPIQHIPIIFYTATYASEQDKRFALSLGASHFFNKPMKMSALMVIVDTVLKTNQLTTSSNSLEFHPSSLNNTDEPYVDHVSNKLEKRIIEMSLENENLI